MEARGAGDLDAAEPQRLAGSERVAVAADARIVGRQRAGPRAAARLASRSSGTRHLEVGGIAGDDMDGDSTGLQEGGLVGPGPSVGGRRREAPARQDRAPDALRRLRRDQPGRSTVAVDPLAVDPLEGLGDRHDRDRGAVPFVRPRRRRSRAPPDDRPRPVVDEDDPLAGRVRDAPLQRERTPLATESWRRAPPSTNVDRGRPASQAPARSASRAFGGRHDDDRLDLRRCRRARRACGRAAADRRSVASSLSIPPIRVEAPAATTIASADGPATAQPVNRAAAGRRSSGRRRSGGRA